MRGSFWHLRAKDFYIQKGVIFLSYLHCYRGKVVTLSLNNRVNLKKLSIARDMIKLALSYPWYSLLFFSDSFISPFSPILLLVRFYQIQHKYSIQILDQKPDSTKTGGVSVDLVYRERDLVKTLLYSEKLS